MKGAPSTQSTPNVLKVNKIQNKSPHWFFGWVQNYDFSEGFFHVFELSFHR